MARQKKILDASVALKWFFKEKGSNIADNILKAHINEDIVIIVPELFFYEVTNALRFQHKNVEELKAAINDLEIMQLSIEKYSFELIKLAVENALKYKLTVYDSLYLTLAEKLNAKLVTADEAIILSKHPLVESL